MDAGTLVAFVDAPAARLPCVVSNDLAGSAVVTRHLIQLGQGPDAGTDPIATGRFDLEEAHGLALGLLRSEASGDRASAPVRRVLPPSLLLRHRQA